MKRFHFHRWHAAVFILAGIYLIVAGNFFTQQFTVLKQGLNGALSSIRLAYRDVWRAYIAQDINENLEILRSERNAYARKAVHQDILEQENAQLKNLLSFKQRSDSVLLGARIVGKSADLARSMIMIDRGAIDGVKKDLPVIAGDGELIGKIAEAQYETSFVRLLHDPKSKTIASYKTKGAAVQGIITGTFHTGIELTLVPITEQIEKGALIYTTGAEENIPAGLLIGFISEYKSTPTDLFYTIQAKPALLVSELSLVHIILPQKTNEN